MTARYKKNDASKKVNFWKSKKNGILLALINFNEILLQMNDLKTHFGTAFAHLMPKCLQCFYLALAFILTQLDGICTRLLYS